MMSIEAIVALNDETAEQAALDSLLPREIRRCRPLAAISIS